MFLKVMTVKREINLFYISQAQPVVDDIKGAQQRNV